MPSHVTPQIRKPAHTPHMVEPRGAPAVTGKSPRKTVERDLQRSGSEFLALDGWRCIATDPPQLRGLAVQEKGIPDNLYIRYDRQRILAFCESLWVEWKSPKGKPSQHQIAWHAAERARGALTLIAGVDFPATIDGLMSFYFASGLAVKVRPSNGTEARRVPA